MIRTRILPSIGKNPARTATFPNFMRKSQEPATPCALKMSMTKISCSLPKSAKSKGNKNLYTLYWTNLFSKEKLSDEAAALQHSGKVVIKNARYDITKDRRVTHDEYFLHCSITMNFKSESVGEMSYAVTQLHLYSSNDNKVYPVPLPEDDTEMQEKFRALNRHMQNFRLILSCLRAPKNALITFTTTFTTDRSRPKPTTEVSK